jgi:ubiquinone/menaquinone biosynthesis C-methylase UbiE
LRVFEIGCGTGRTTLALLESREDLVIRAADNEPAMLDQARGNLSQHIGQGRVQLIEADALSGPYSFYSLYLLSPVSFITQQNKGLTQT